MAAPKKKTKTWPMSELAKVIVRAAVNTRAAATDQFEHDVGLARTHDKVPDDAGSDGEVWTEFVKKNGS